MKDGLTDGPTKGIVIAPTSSKNLQQFTKNDQLTLTFAFNNIDYAGSPKECLLW